MSTDVTENEERVIKEQVIKDLVQKSSEKKKGKNIKQVKTSTETPTRKRGRPKKQVTDKIIEEQSLHSKECERETQLEQEDNENLLEKKETPKETPTRKRGRPKKQVVDEAVGDKNLSAIERERGMQCEQENNVLMDRVEEKLKKGRMEEEVSSQKVPSIETPARKRGRPKKKVIYEAAGDRSLSLIECERTMQCEQEDNTREEVLSKETPTRRRGRPKKQFVADHSVSSSECEKGTQSKQEHNVNLENTKGRIDEDSPVVKKKRGRPRKPKDPESTSDEHEPKKARTNDDDADETSLRYTTKSGRKVTRNRHTDDDSTFTTSTESDTEREGGGGGNTHIDISKLDEHYKKLYEKFKEKAEVWVEDLNGRGSAKCAWCSVNFKKLKSILKHHDRCNELYKSGFLCKVCGGVFKSPASLNYHVLANHTTEVLEERKLDKHGKIKSEKTLLKQLLRQKKKLQCKVTSCEKSFTTVHGYLYHRDRCGKEVVKYLCAFCEGTYISEAGLKYHIKSMHTKSTPVVEPIKEDKDEVDMGVNASGKRRRSAAHKAMASMKELKEKGFVEIKDTEKETTSKYDYHLFTSPNIVIDTDLVQKWKLLFSKKQRVSCPFDCDYESSLLAALKDHCNSCKNNPNIANCEPYRCNLCGKEYTSKPSIKSHVKFHKQEDRQKYFIEHNIAEFESSDSDEDKIVTDGEDEEDLEDDDVSLEFGECDDLIPAVSLRQNMVLAGQCVEHFLKWKKTNHCDLEKRLFQESSQQLKEWKLLSKSESEKVEPKCMRSPRFKIKVDNGSTDIENVTYDESEKPFILERYQCLEQTSANKYAPKTMFVGGPVWAIAWCPTPHGKPSANQYAAISCHSYFDSTHKNCTRYEYPGVIQMWNFGSLLDKAKHRMPVLSYGIAHNCGALWDLKWCPSGCWDDPTDIKEGSIPRLGVFAVACSNSTVCVFAAPHEEALNTEGNEGQHDFYDVEPTLTLKPSSCASDWTAIGQCWCLDWLPCQPHNLIVAGFSNGLIAFWNLTTSSPLLREGSSNKLYPYKTILAHGNQVSSISWCPSDINFLASVGYDGRIHFWNLQDSYQPLLTLERPHPLACRWMVHSKGIVCCRDTITSGHASVTFQDYGAFYHKTQTIIQKQSCMLALDASNWLNGIVAGDVLGDVRCQVLKLSKRSNNRWQYMFPIYRTTIKHIRNISNNGSTDSGNKENDCVLHGDDEEEKNEKSTSLASAYDESVLIFHDAVRGPIGNTVPAIVKRLHQLDKVSHFQLYKPLLASVQRASWNPNLCAVGWVLTGGESGLVRAHYIKGIFYDSLKDQIATILKQHL
ncbi:uncharacterized protein [Antedon mediterranea]|uniref:uncharacterized protein n=1 Tax=Antedon mediterranea TaxID=105859 RepID=UPI003AF90DAF